MDIKNIPVTQDFPNNFNAIIEIPANTPGIKYELDKVSGAIFVDRFISTPMHYPCNYGFIPSTLSEDGDPVDVLVIAPYSLMPGVVITCRTIGMLSMEDEAGKDNKIIAVPISKLTDLYDTIQDIRDLPGKLVKQITYFFEHYKDLESGKWVKITDWMDVLAAKTEIISCVERARRKN